jgi:hypothetical protein
MNYKRLNAITGELALTVSRNPCFPVSIKMLFHFVDLFNTSRVSTTHTILEALLKDSS